MLALAPAAANETAAPWSVVWTDCSEPEPIAKHWTFASDVCQAEDSVISSISTCSDDGKTLKKQFFMNPYCSGQPLEDVVLPQNQCQKAANGAFYSYACRPAVPTTTMTTTTATTTTTAAAPWSVVRIEGECDYSCVAARIWYKLTGRGALETFVSGVCHTTKDSVGSEISTCSDDGKILKQQFFMNPNCEGQPLADFVLQQNHCSEDASGMHYAYFCRPASA
jgi:hypothetical protein